MTDPTEDQAVERLVRRAGAYDDTSLAAGSTATALREAQLALLEEIVATPTSSARRRRRRHPGRQTLAAAAVVAVALAIGVPTWVLRSGDQRALAGYSAQAREVADANPRLLIGEPGWRITHVDEFAPDEGEMTFSKDGRELEVNWRRADEYQGYVDDRGHVSTGEPVEVLGQNGTMYRYTADDFTTILPVRGASFLEIRGGVGDRTAYLDVLGELEHVSSSDWLAAMPASVVTPSDEKKVAEAMLADVPLPPGFDRSTLPTGGTNDYYQYGATVTGAVVCGWIDSYRTAQDAGDAAGQRRAVDALESSHQWKVLHTMDADGGWSGVVWDIADEIRDGRLHAESYYESVIGCH